MLSEGDGFTESEDSEVIVNIVAVVVGVVDHAAHLTINKSDSSLQQSVLLTLALTSPSGLVMSCSPRRT